MLIKILCGFLLGAGLFLVAADFFRLPTLKTSKAMKSLSARQKSGPSSIDVWLEGLAVWISKLIRVNEYKRIQLESDLRTADMQISPELFIARCIVKASIVCLLIPLALLFFPVMTLPILFLAFCLYRQNLKSVNRVIQQQREAIEFELTRFVFTIEKTLMHSRDVLGMLDSYRVNAGPEFRKQLDITIADMRSSNYEAALTRLEARVGSSMLSDVCRGLQGILRGDNTISYWSSLGVKFADIQRQAMKKKALRAPDKVRRLSMCLLFCFLMIYIVVIVAQIISSLDIMFG